MLSKRVAYCIAMTRIEPPEDFAQPARVTVGHTLLRFAVGGILIAHAAQRLLRLEVFQDQLAVQFALLEPGAAAHLLLGIELTAGAGLVFGWFTRFSSLLSLCSIGVSVALEVTHQAEFKPQIFELPALLAIATLYFLLAGGGPVSLDEWLHARARRKAIENDDRWLKHPYVPVPGEPSYEEPPAAGYEQSYAESRYEQQTHEAPRYEPQSYHEPPYEEPRDAEPYEELRDAEPYEEPRDVGQSYELPSHEQSYDREPGSERDEPAHPERDEPHNRPFAGYRRR